MRIERCGCTGCHGDQVEALYIREVEADGGVRGSVWAHEGCGGNVWNSVWAREGRESLGREV